MRELRFRVWIKDEERYYDESDEESYMIVPNGNVTYTSESYEEDGVWFNDTTSATNDVVVEQYTGLKDKNGKEIYEGDIIQEEIDFNSKMTDGVYTYVVEWDSDTLCYGLRGNGNSIHDLLWEVNASVEIVGNIHENPELLEEE